MAQAAVQQSPKRTEVGRMFRFMTVGLSGTVIDFIVLAFLKEFLLFPTAIANVLSFSAGLINNFTWNRLWTFADAENTDAMKQFLQFAAVSVVGLLLNTSIVLALEAPLGALFSAESMGYLPAKVIATVIVFGWNFSANRLWTFKR